MTAPHETPEFQNSVEYTIQITVTVEGGARWQTAYRRAERIAERLANHATRAAHVVEVHGLAGPSRDGEPVRRDPIRFSAANAGRGTYGDPSKLDRYIDPDFERALDSLGEVNAKEGARRRADRERRLDLACRNAYRLDFGSPARCLCVYCRPADHEHALHVGSGDADFLFGHRCLCGASAPAPHATCRRHGDHQLVVLEGDPEALERVAHRLDQRRIERELNGPPAGRSRELGRPDPPSPDL